MVVDDAAQNVTHIVRGADLLHSTPRQIYLQQLLGFATHDLNKISYSHVPVAVNALGKKLSKQTLAKPLLPQAAPALVFEALCFLGQQPPAELENTDLSDIWQWAIANWQLAHVPQVKLLTPKNVTR